MLGTLQIKGSGIVAGRMSQGGHMQKNVILADQPVGIHEDMGNLLHPVAVGHQDAPRLAGCPGSVHQLTRIVFADLGCSAGDVRLSSGKEAFIINCRRGLGILR